MVGDKDKVLVRKIKREGTLSRRRRFRNAGGGRVPAVLSC